MTKPRTPSYRYDRDTNLLYAFREVANLLGDSEDQATFLFKLLPFELRNVSAYFDTESKSWHYEYGEPFDNLPNDKIVFGSFQCPEVVWLYRGIQEIDRRIALNQPEQFVEIIQRLSIKEKHLDTLTELYPLTRVGQDVIARHEVSGYSDGDTRIDWLFKKHSSVPILLEVKCRCRDLLSQYTKLAKSLPSDSLDCPPPDYDFDSLFSGTYSKYNSVDPNVQLQGAWLNVPVKQPRSELESYFHQLPFNKLHFVILDDLRNVAACFAVSDTINNHVMQFFSLSHTNDYFV